jgi:hypothetical protein
MILFLVQEKKIAVVKPPWLGRLFADRPEAALETSSPMLIGFVNTLSLIFSFVLLLPVNGNGKAVKSFL